MNRRRILQALLALLSGCNDPMSTVTTGFRMPTPTQPNAAPTIPTGLSVNAVSTSEIDLNWNASSDPSGPGVKDYGVYRTDVGLLGFVPTTSYADTGLAPSTTKTYAVTARSITLVESQQAGPISATTFAGGSGAFTQGQPFTLVGSGFGAPTASVVPVKRDIGAAALGTLDAQWDGGNNVPGTSNPMVNTAFGVTPVATQINAPHPYVISMLAGSHVGSGAGGVFVAGSYTAPTLPYAFRMSWRRRGDPSYVFNINNGGTGNNFKWFATGPGINVTNQAKFIGVPDSSAWGSNVDGGKQAAIGDNSLVCLQNPDAGSHGFFWPSSSESKPPFVFAENQWNPANGWIYCETMMYVTATTGLAGGGYWKYFENGQEIVNKYQGSTDTLAGSTRFVSVGDCFSRNWPNANNWAFVCDVVLQVSSASLPAGGQPAYVVMTDQPTYSGSSIFVDQPLTSWADTLIKGTFYKGGLTGACYAQVFQENGSTQTLGPFTISGTP